MTLELENNVAPPCSICISPQRAEIDEALSVPKASFRSITARFPDFGRTAVRNHAHAHHPTAVESRQRRAAALGKPRVIGRTKAPATAPVVAPIGNPEDVVTEFKRLYAKAVAAVESAESMKDARLALSALKEANGILSQIARSYGVFSDETRPTLVVDRSQRIVNVLGAMSEDELRRILTDTPPAALVAAIDGELTQ